jgi:hypothetical protein
VDLRQNRFVIASHLGPREPLRRVEITGFASLQTSFLAFASRRFLHASGSAGTAKYILAERSAAARAIAADVHRAVKPGSVQFETCSCICLSWTHHHQRSSRIHKTRRINPAQFAEQVLSKSPSLCQYGGSFGMACFGFFFIELPLIRVFGRTTFLGNRLTRKEVMNFGTTGS